MLLIPIGQVDGEVRRQPWVTWGLIALNVLVAFGIAVWSGAHDWQKDAEERAQEVEEYWIEHPYLKVPPQLFGELKHDLETKLHEGIDQSRRAYEKAHELPIPMLLTKQQTDLTRRIDRLFAALHRDPKYRYGFIPSHPTFETLLTSMFVHSGIWHLFGNMMFLFATGAFIEDVFGRFLYLVLYLSAGAVAALAHMGMEPASTVPLVGASGAIAGVMGAYLVRLVRSKMAFVFMPFEFLPVVSKTFSMPAYVVLPLWIVIQCISAVLAPDAPIAWWAHIGGFTFGALFAAVVKLSRLEERVIAPAIEKEIGWEEDPEVVRALDARSQGRWGEAADIARALAARDPRSADAQRLAYDCALDAKDLAEAGAAATRLLELYEKAGDKQLASQLAHQAAREARGGLPPRFYMVAASVREKENLSEAAFDLYEELLVLHAADPAAPRALLKMADIRLRDRDASAARGILELALTHPLCVDAFRMRVETLLASDALSLAPRPRSLPLRVSAEAFRRAAAAPAAGASMRVAPSALASAPHPVSSAGARGAPRTAAPRSSAVPRAGARPARSAGLRIAAIAAGAAVLGAGGVLAWRARGGAARTEEALPRIASAPPAAFPTAVPLPTAALRRVEPAAAEAFPEPTAAPVIRLTRAGVPLHVTCPPPPVAGTLVVHVGRAEVLRRVLQTAAEGGAPLDVVLNVPSGPAELSVAMIGPDRKVRGKFILQVTLGSYESRTLAIDPAATGVYAVFE